MQMLIFFLQQEMVSLFKFFTLNVWRVENFRARYMSDSVENEVIGDAGNGAGGELLMRLGNKVIDGTDSEDEKKKEEIVNHEHIDPEVEGEAPDKSVK